MFPSLKPFPDDITMFVFPMKTFVQPPAPTQWKAGATGTWEIWGHRDMGNVTNSPGLCKNVCKTLEFVTFFCRA